MNIEIDDDYADEIVAACLRETYLRVLADIKKGFQYPGDMEVLEELVMALPTVLSYFMTMGAYEEFMQRVEEMNEND
tara:strand:+ start:2584 stop:2814 length:231 start_codon:yes stop_codon:yes gene_type:complete